MTAADDKAQIKTDLNKKVIQCVLGLVKNISKHSVTQVRGLLFKLLEHLTLLKQVKKDQSGKAIHQSANIIDSSEVASSAATKPEPPFLPPIAGEKIFTLVLDLDETLIHFIELPVESSSGGHFLIRPGARKFLEEMA